MDSVRLGDRREDRTLLVGGAITAVRWVVLIGGLTWFYYWGVVPPLLEPLFGMETPADSGPNGIPSEREQIIGLIIFSLVVLTVGKQWRRSILSVVNWIPFVVLMILYDLTRGVADETGIPIQVEMPIVADKIMCGGCYANTVLREWIPTTAKGSPNFYWYEVLFSLAYGSHFFLPYFTAAVLWVKDIKRFHHFRDAFFLMTFIGLVGYVLLPTTPPWLAGEAGLVPDIDSTTRTAGNGWSFFNITWAESVLDKGRGIGNAVAAMPSLHAAYSLFFSMAIWRRSSWQGAKPFLAAFPLLMGITLVVSSEHYIIDIVAGFAVAAAALWIFSEERYSRIRSKVKELMVNHLGFHGIQHAFGLDPVVESGPVTDLTVDIDLAEEEKQDAVVGQDDTSTAENPSVEEPSGS